ncbi:MAG: hypothetical protein JSS34_03780 [Proteobacteria bacterium]|nr:hypothetical protein [Pseudomonadota bacterium]
MKRKISLLSLAVLGAMTFWLSSQVEANKLEDILKAADGKDGKSCYDNCHDDFHWGEKWKLGICIAVNCPQVYNDVKKEL